MPIHLPPLDRRRFLAGALAAGAGWAGPWARALAEPAPPTDPHVWAFFSDTHVAASREETHAGVNMAEHLARSIAGVLAAPTRPAGVLVNGDCAYLSGESGDYATFLALVEPLRAAGLPVHLGLGNHDHRERFWQAATGQAEPPTPVRDKHVSVTPGGRVNWFLLDSLDRPGMISGALGERQVAWLAHELDAHADRPAVVLGHHQLVPGGKVGTGLADTDALWEVLVPRRQVKAYIYGHTHHWRVAEKDGLHLVNLPPTAYPFIRRDPSGWVRCTLGEGGATLELISLDEGHPAHGQRVELAWRS